MFKTWVSGHQLLHSMFLNGPNMSTFVCSEFLNTMIKNNTCAAGGTCLFNLITQEAVDNLSEFKASQEHMRAGSPKTTSIPFIHKG